MDQKTALRDLVDASILAYELAEEHGDAAVKAAALVFVLAVGKAIAREIAKNNPEELSRLNQAKRS